MARSDASGCIGHGRSAGDQVRSGVVVDGDQVRSGKILRDMARSEGIRHKICWRDRGDIGQQSREINRAPARSGKFYDEVE
jgi:hypothetical protein